MKMFQRRLRGYQAIGYVPDGAPSLFDLPNPEKRVGENPPEDMAL